MAAVTSLSDIIAKLTGASNGNPEALVQHKQGRIGAAALPASVSGRWYSGWQMNGAPSGGAAPGGTARNPTSATAGALPFTNPGGGRTKLITALLARAQVAAQFLLVDRLADISGLSGTSTSAQATTGLSVSRYTGAASVGNMVALEIYTAIGATGTTVKMSYTNQAGTAGQISPLTAIGASGDNGQARTIWMPLAQGDTGVRSVESVTLTATTGTAGDFGVTIFRPLRLVAAPGIGLVGVKDLITGYPGPEPLIASACLSWMVAPISTTPADEMTLILQTMES